MTLEQKTVKLHTILEEYGRVAIAFSGGVDSSLLLKSAIDTLGPGNVLALSARTCLVRPEEQQAAASWLDRHGLTGVDFQPVDLHPLSWKEFVGNSEERCYHCKLRIYKEFFEVMHKRDMQVLLDGTNTDDLKNRRPGLRAIHELGVKTPLVEAGFDKNDVRARSRILLLDTSERPSSSCLATRIPHGLEVTADRIDTIAGYEKGMEKLGFAGFRVRLHPLKEDAVILQLQEDDFERFSRPGMRVAVVRFFQKAGVRSIFLDLIGR